MASFKDGRPDVGSSEMVGGYRSYKLTPYRLLMPPHPLLGDSSLTPQRPYITKQIKVILDFPAIFSMNKVDVKVYIFPAISRDSRPNVYRYIF